MNTENFDKYRKAEWRKVQVTVDDPSINRLALTKTETVATVFLTGCVATIAWFVWSPLMLGGVAMGFFILKEVRKVRRTRERGSLLHGLWLRGIPFWVERTLIPRSLFFGGEEKRYVP